jgi:hypothetical protein
MFRNTILTLAGVLSLAAPIQAQQQVAFIGDNFTFNWGTQPQFQAHKNWLAYGALTVTHPGNGSEGTSATLAALQAIIQSGKKPIIHLIEGESNSESGTPGNQHSLIFAFWAVGFEKIITTAQQAHLPIVVGTIPFSEIGDVSDMNKFIFTYCNTHGIPVVNYDFALNGGTGFAASGHLGYGNIQPAPPQTPIYIAPPIDQGGNLPQYALTSQGWDLVTDMADVATELAGGQIKFKSGYLGDVTYDANQNAASTPQNNQTADGGIVQFTPYAVYTDGSTHVINNADQFGHIGVWTNSNPKSLFLDQNGVGTGMSPGSTSIHFTTLQGQILSSWTQYTWDDDLGCNCTTY